MSPSTFPLSMTAATRPSASKSRREASIHAVAENALDVPHTAFLHGGLFRSEQSISKNSNELSVEIRRWGDRVEAEFFGEPRPSGIVGRVLAPGRDDEVQHIDRFILPSIVEVDYKLGERIHFRVSAALTPVDDFHTRLFAAASFRLPVPGALIVPVLRPLALRIFSQDAAILKSQTETQKAFGQASYLSTEIDALGPQILRLLRQAERGERPKTDEPHVRRFSMVT